MPVRFPPRLAGSSVEKKKWINSSEIRWFVTWGESEKEVDDKEHFEKTMGECENGASLIKDCRRR